MFGVHACGLTISWVHCLCCDDPR